VLGLLVDSVTEVLQIPAHTIEPPPPLVAGIDAAYIKGIGKFEDRLLILLDLGKILSKNKTEDSAIEN
jgi:purine-binding chemotaxis protein CheW